MSSDQTFEVIDSLVEMTRYREQSALIAVLIQLLSDLVSPAKVVRYKVEKDGFIPVVEENSPSAASNSIAPELLEIFQDCYDSGRRGILPSYETTTLVYPIKGTGSEVVELLVIETTIGDVLLHHQAGQILAIYNNFLGLIRDNERDALTGLLNRKTFETRMGKVLSKIRYAGHRHNEKKDNEYCLAVIDIDHFKHVNDQFGHLVGDEVLILLSQHMQKNFRDDDYIFRFGGEEFVCLLKSNAEKGQIGLNRLRVSVEQYKFPQVGKVTISIGVSNVTENDISAAVMDRADQALYYAKQNGRNRVCIYEQLVNEGYLKTAEIQSGDIELF